ncbi:TetR/AcrR family transcriptional regulator [Peribacillus cavernae]|uniref:TetR/AcrR family transcriptional regulator n=1 Tax=Peribacillus cavernae TaxID=1674310 RepID=A0A3S0U137_9BACI|nr:TetR/AcrR family transcriptional regulator [Peribacillus cavernae]RUQ28059.1 TetR/AcrR family transcriptional regulator [Peribacillus cavernae]
MDLKDRIIETSLTLFEQHGFHGVTVNQIVSESGTSKGGFYHHFQSKDELLFVIHDYFISYVLTKAKETIETNDHPTEKMQKIIKSFVKVFDIYKPHISVFYQESIYLKPQYVDAIKEKRQSYKAVLFDVIREGIEKREFRSELPVEITVMSILGMVNWSYKWYKKDGEKTIEEIADIYVDLILHSLLTEQTKKDARFKEYFLENHLTASKK